MEMLVNMQLTGWRINLFDKYIKLDSIIFLFNILSIENAKAVIDG